MDEGGCCARCDRPIRVMPYYTRRDVPAEMLREVLDRPLRDLGVEAPRSLLVRFGERVIQFRPAGSDDTSDDTEEM